MFYWPENIFYPSNFMSLARSGKLSRSQYATQYELMGAQLCGLQAAPPAVTHSVSNGLRCGVEVNFL